VISNIRVNDRPALARAIRYRDFKAGVVRVLVAVVRAFKHTQPVDGFKKNTEETSYHLWGIATPGPPLHDSDFQRLPVESKTFQIPPLPV
jgi:hypothetical protein